MLINQPEKRLAGFKLALFASGFTLCVIVLGAFTRLVDAGLGCPDWPVCYGHILWPMDQQEVQIANAAFPDTPVEHDKTWPEQVHRLFASSLGLLCIALCFMAIKNRSSAQAPLKLPIFILGLVILQGLFGMWTVTLNLWPQVVTAHLLGGFSTFSLLCLLTLRLNNSWWRVGVSDFQKIIALRPWLILALLVVILQIFLGGWTTSNYAALACPDFPQCQNAWLPTMNFSTGFNFWQHIGPNYLGGVMDSAARTAIHFSHRIGALVTVFVIVLLAVKMKRSGIGLVQRWANVLLLILLLQVLLGVTNILAALPLGVAVSHNTVGAILLAFMVGLCHRVFTASVLENE